MKVGFNTDAFARYAGRQHQDRHGVGIRLGDAAESVFGAGAVLRQKDAGLFAIVDARKAVGHVHAGAFLAADDGPDAGNGGGFD